VTGSILWDSSAILALLDADDADHARAVAVARDIASDARPSFVTNYIEAEAHALLLRKLGRIARQWLLTAVCLCAVPRKNRKPERSSLDTPTRIGTFCDAISFACSSSVTSDGPSPSITTSDNTAGFTCWD
jgi:hypothetical protein